MIDFKLNFDKLLESKDEQDVRNAINDLNEQKTILEKNIGIIENDYIEDLRYVKKVHGDDAYNSALKDLNEITEEAQIYVNKLNVALNKLEELQEEIGNKESKEIVEKYQNIVKELQGAVNHVAEVKYDNNEVQEVIDEINK